MIVLVFSWTYWTPKPGLTEVMPLELGCRARTDKRAAFFLVASDVQVQLGDDLTSVGWCSIPMGTRRAHGRIRYCPCDTLTRSPS